MAAYTRTSGIGSVPFGAYTVPVSTVDVPPHACPKVTGPPLDEDAALLDEVAPLEDVLLAFVALEVADAPPVAPEDVAPDAPPVPLEVGLPELVLAPPVPEEVVEVAKLVVLLAGDPLDATPLAPVPLVLVPVPPPAPSERPPVTFDDEHAARRTEEPRRERR